MLARAVHVPVPSLLCPSVYRDDAYAGKQIFTRPVKSSPRYTGSNNERSQFVCEEAIFTGNDRRLVMRRVLGFG